MQICKIDQVRGCCALLGSAPHLNLLMVLSTLLLLGVCDSLARASWTADCFPGPFLYRYNRGMWSLTMDIFGIQRVDGRSRFMLRMCYGHPPAGRCLARLSNPLGSFAPAICLRSPAACCLFKLRRLSASDFVRGGFSSTELESLRLQNRELRSQIAAVHWPPLAAFAAHGRIHSLPCRCPTGNQNQPDEAVLQYLSGFFDGDGCVEPTSVHSGCSLRVVQSYDSPEILLFLQESLCGRIYSANRGRGLMKPTLRWYVGGQEARHVARLLASRSITKKRQLELAARWPSDRLQRGAAAEEMQCLKHYDSSVDGACTWAYCAGFFDADGCFKWSGAKSFCLSFSQKFPTVLHCIRRFLLDETAARCRLRRASSGVFELDTGCMASTKQILEAMLSAGMLRKAAQARLALSVTRMNSDQIRAAMTELVGNQCFGRRLDQEGLERARKIIRSRQKGQYLLAQGQHDAAETKFLETESLKQKHELLKAKAEHDQLQAYLFHITSLHARWADTFAGANGDAGMQLQQFG